VPVKIVLPSQFDAPTLFRSIGNDILPWTEVPSEVVFDFSALRFVRPSGVVFTSNLTRFLAYNGCRVLYDGLNVRKSSHKYLDDSQFFREHMGGQLDHQSCVRETTLPLIQIAHTDVFQWINFTLVPWLVTCTGLPEGSFAELRTCISEVFNNISDHSTLNVGSVFCQWFPKEDRIRIAIADFGSGIPATVRRVSQGLSDEQAISQAFDDGFSSKSLPSNRGAGLHFLRQNVVGNLGGTLTVLSGKGGGGFLDASEPEKFVPYSVPGFCPGTMLELEIRTDKFDPPKEVEEFKW